MYIGIVNLVCVSSICFMQKGLIKMKQNTINMTPHDFTLYDNEGNVVRVIPPSGKTIRASLRKRRLLACGMECHWRTQIMDLPISLSIGLIPSTLWAQWWKTHSLSVTTWSFLRKQLETKKIRSLVLGRLVPDPSLPLPFPSGIGWGFFC